MNIDGLGEVPSDWSSVPGRRVLTLQRRPVGDGGIVTAFRDGVVTLRERRRTEGFTNALKEIGYQGVEPGDLVVHSMDGFAGAIGVSDSRGRMSPVANVFTVAGDARYFAYVLRTLALGGYVTSLAKGIRERSTSFDAATVLGLTLPQPSNQEQRRIADFLDERVARIDQIIAGRRREELLMSEARGSAAALQLDGVGTPGLLKHLLAAPPCYGVLKPEYQDGGVRVVRITDLLPDGYIDEKRLRRIADAQSREYRRTILKGGDVVVGVVGTLGRPVVVDSSLAGSNVTRAVARLQPRPGVPSAYLRAWLLGPAFRKFVDEVTQGTAQAVLNMGDLKNLPVRIPLPSEMSRIATAIHNEEHHWNSRASHARRSASLLQEYKQSLITAAVTGELDVTTASTKIPGE